MELYTILYLLCSRCLTFWVEDEDEDDVASQLVVSQSFIFLWRDLFGYAAAAAAVVVV